MARKAKVKVEIDGEAIVLIAQLSIHQMIQGHHQFELRCPVKESGTSLIDFCQQHIQKEIKIELAPGLDPDSTANFFRGIVTGIGLNKNMGAAEEIIITGSSPSIILEDGPHCQSFLEMPLSNIVNNVVGRYGESAQVDPMYQAALPYHVQYKESSFAFLRRTAATYGEWFYYDGSQLCFGNREEGEEIELKFGRDLFSFDMGLYLKPTHFKWMGYDPVHHQFPESSSADLNLSDLDEYGNIALEASETLFAQSPVVPAQFPALRTNEDLNAVAQKRRNSLASDLVYFTGNSDNLALTVGATIKTTGSYEGGDAEYGSFTIIKVSHLIDNLGNYQNHFVAIPAILSSPPNLFPGHTPLCEAQIAEVIDNHDTEELGRLQVQFPWQKADGGTSPWIRLVSTAGGGTHGFYFMPEIGDQVLVGFEYNDPNLPYVMGAMYHGEAKPQEVSDPNNNKKVLRTKSGNQIALSDEGGGEGIRIVNGSNVLTLTMGEGGKITISTDGALELNGKTVSIASKELFEIKAGKELKVSSGDDTVIHAGTNGKDFKVHAGSGVFMQADGKDFKVIAKSALTLDSNEGDIRVKTPKVLNLQGVNCAKLSGNNIEIKGESSTDISAPNHVTVKSDNGTTEITGMMVKLN